MFSSRCATDEVPGMSSRLGERTSSQASATCIGVVSSRRATERLALWRSVRNNGTALPAAGLIDQLRTALRTDLDSPSALQTVDAWVAGSLAVDSDDTGAIPAMEEAVDALLGIKL